MPKINLLDRSVYELIAAGEVIERPAAVIKELAENSVDAGARSVSVEIKHGGVTYIRVTDDGCGIARDEIPSAFLRHATSKVLYAEDLEHINTLGFRGEALASVSAVSRVEMITKRPEDDFGTLYRIEAGEPAGYESAGCPDGTTVIVRDLFFNTPARLKFLKKDVTEGNYCAAVVEKLALSHPNVSFRFIRDGKQAFVTPGDGDYYSAVYAVLGKQFAAGMLPIENVYRDISVMGYVSAPIFTRSNRAMQYFFVNGRSVRSPLCSAALEEAYRNSMMVGKFPACILQVNLDPSLYDANISPTKTEVRFSEEKILFDAIYIAVKNGLAGYNQSREVVLPDVGRTPGAPSTVEIPSGGRTVLDAPQQLPQRPVFPERPAPAPATGEASRQGTLLPREEAVPAAQSAPAAAAAPTAVPAPKAAALEGFAFLSPKSFEQREYKQEYMEGAPIPKEDAADELSPEKDGGAQAAVRVIGELFKTYIVCESGEALLLIDKHAAHERINFERFRKGVNSHAQLLLEPVEVPLTPEEYEALSAFSARLAQIGLVFRESDCGAIVEGMPQALDGVSPAEVLQGMAAVLARGGGDEKGVLFDEALHTMACKASIRGGETQDISELAYLANIVINDPDIRYCPHGRPVITQISRRQIEKYFGRIQN